MFKVIVDANIWIRFARSKTIAPLVHRFSEYGLIPVVNQYLISEVFHALINNRWATENQAMGIIRFIEKISIVIAENVVYRLGLIPKTTTCLILLYNGTVRSSLATIQRY